MDLTSLSDQDFDALQAGNLSKMSEAGFAQLLKAQDAEVPKQVKAERAAARATAEARIANDPTKGMSGAQLLAAGGGKFITDIGRALKQAMPGSSVTREMVDEQKALDAPLMNTWQGKTGYLGGAAAVGAPLMLAPGANTITGAAMYGAGLGALSPVGTDDSVLQNAALGAAGGAVGAGVAKGASRVLAPKMQPGTQGLMDAGIVLTPGQRLGGAWKRGEDALTSMPFTGDFIRTQQRRTFEEFNSALANKALAPIKTKLPKGVIGRDAIAYTEKAIGDAYESVLNRVGTVRADRAFDGEIANLTQMVRSSTMPADVQAQFNKAIAAQIKGKLQGQSTMTAQTFKQAEGELGRLASLYGADASVDKQLLGDALQEAQAALRRLLERSAGPQHAADVKAANAGWAEFKRMQRASTAAGAKDGVFSPEQYMNAVKALDTSKDKSSFARGTALGQQFGADALRVMGATVPDSGTPFRTLMANPINGLVSGTLGSPAAAAYSGRPVQNALQILASGKRPALATRAAAELEAAGPALAALGITGVNAYRQTKP